MKSLFHTNIRQPLIVLLLIVASTLIANAQDSRIQTASLDHLAANAEVDIPAPFARIRIAIGEPYYPKKKMTDEEMAQAQEELQRRLHETFKIAQRSL